MKCSIAIIIIAILAIPIAAPAQITQATQSKALTAIGGISAENGEFSFEGNQVTAFSDKDISFWQGANGKREFVATVGGAFPVEVRSSQLVNIRANVSSTAAHEFPLCDSSDQISRWIESDIRDALPKDSKIKTRAEFIDGRGLVAYSKPGTDHYLLMLSLFESTPENHYRLVATESVTEFGEYCGMLVLSSTVSAVLVDEPGGSSDSNAVYFFAIQPKKAVAKSR